MIALLEAEMSADTAQTRNDGRPSYAVSFMELQDGKVTPEIQYFADPFEPGPSRAQYVEHTE